MISKYKMVKLILRSVAINRNNVREVSLCKWLIWLPEMYPVVICIFAIAEISRIFLTKLGGTLSLVYHSFHNHSKRLPMLLVALK